jgi:hypothetical protein
VPFKLKIKNWIPIYGIKYHIIFLVLLVEHIWTWSWLLHLLGGYTFYATGNQATLDAIPWRAAFVLLPGNFPYKAASGFLILTAMFSGRLLASLMAQRKAGIEDEQASLYLLLFGALKVFSFELIYESQFKI